MRLQSIKVLSQIAFGYLACYFIIQLKFRWQAVVAGLMLAGYWVLVAAFPGPEGQWSKSRNIDPSGNFAFMGPAGSITQHLLVFGGLWWICSSL